MSGDYTGFAAWLRERAMAADFDLDARGGIAKLAAASGVDPAQMSRALRGLAVPAIEGQRGLAKALGIKLPEVMIHAGWAEPDDFDEPAAAPPSKSYELERAAEILGVPPGKRRTYVQLMKSMAALTGSQIVGEFIDDAPQTITLGEPTTEDR